VLITQAFEKLANVVSSGSRLPDLHRHVLPHPLNPLPDDRVKAIMREHLKGMLGKLVDARG
jgi:hypothetical protein